MSLILKPIALHAIVGNAPYVISALATAAPGSIRVFQGTGAPSSSTLNAGNAAFNGIASGFAANATLYTSLPGSGYATGDVLTVSGGTGTSMKITVDMVNDSGVIVDFHVSTIGNYSVYPEALSATTGGTGSGAYFLINVPPPDFYFDITTISSPVMYVCTNGGSHSSSEWAEVSGGSGAVQQFKMVSDGGDWWVCKTWDGSTEGSDSWYIIKPQFLRSGDNAVGSETASGTTYDYSYSGVTVSGVTAYYTRTVTGGVSTELQRLEPVPAAGDIIFAIPCSTTILASNAPPSNPSGGQLLDINADARIWKTVSVEGSDSSMHAVAFQEQKVCANVDGVLTQQSIIVLCSAAYTGSGD